jgi:hypothetical protein
MNMTHQSTGMTSDTAEIQALEWQLIDGIKAKDIKQIMSCYSDDLFAYDVVPPWQYVGAAAFQKAWQGFLGMFKGPINAEVNDLVITMRSCSVPIGALDGAKITTIEGLSSNNGHPVQRAWIAEDVPQCGYCQSGQIMAAVAFLRQFPNPTDADIDANITNICRCGTYESLRRAIHRAADMMSR